MDYPATSSAPEIRVQSLYCLSFLLCPRDMKYKLVTGYDLPGTWHETESMRACIGR